MARKIDLGEALKAKSSELHTKSEAEATLSKSYAALAAEAARDSDTANLHAKAVDQALTILDNAGVTL